MEREQLKGTSITSLINSEENIMQRCLTGDSTFIETWATIKDKKYFFEYRPTPTFDSQGDITGVIEVIIDRTDQKLALQAVSAIDLLIGEINHMSSEHDAGDIDVAIPAEKFEGAYSAMAEGINDMVAGHIAVKKKAMACVAEFAKGNLRRAAGAVPRQEGVHQRHHRALARQRQGVHRRDEPHVGASTTRATSTWSSLWRSSRAPTEPWPKASTRWWTATSP